MFSQICLRVNPSYHWTIVNEKYLGSIVTQLLPSDSFELISSMARALSL